MKALVAGATGAIGRQLLPLAREWGLDVTALAHSMRGKQWLLENEFDLFDCDVLDAVAVDRAFEAIKPDIVVNQVTSIPVKLDPRRFKSQMAATNQLRTLGTANLVHAAREAGVQRVVSQSIAFGYSPESRSPATESCDWWDSAPSGFALAISALRECETLTLEATDMQGIVLRYGHFCGPGTAYAPGGATHKAVKARQLPIIGSGSGEFSFIHVCDAAVATLRAMTTQTQGIYNIVDDQPVAIKEWLPWYAQQIDAKKPLNVPGWIGRLLAGRTAEHMMERQVGADSRLARRELGWNPKRSGWKDGLIQ